MTAVSPDQPDFRHPGRADRPRHQALSWERSIRAWLIDLRRRGYSLLTLRDYHGDVIQFFHFVDVQADEVATQHIESVVPHLVRLGCGDAVIRRKKAAVHSFILWKAAVASGKSLSATIWERVQHEPAQDRLLVALLLFTGVRLSQVTTVEGRDIRLKAGSVTFRSSWRILPLHPKLRDLVVELRTSMPIISYRPIIQSPRGFNLHERTLHARFKKLVERLGFPDARPEDLRREAASHLLQAGTPDGLVSAFLGRDRGMPIAPRKGKYIDLRCLKPRLETFLMTPAVAKVASSSASG